MMCPKIEICDRTVTHATTKCDGMWILQLWRLVNAKQKVAEFGARAKKLFEVVAGVEEGLCRF